MRERLKKAKQQKFDGRTDGQEDRQEHMPTKGGQEKYNNEAV